MILPRRSKPVVVLLHGGLSSSHSMLSGIGRSLAKDFGIGAFDRRGHGRTADTAEDFSYEAMADETIAYLELLGRRAKRLAVDVSRGPASRPDRRRTAPAPPAFRSRGSRLRARPC